MGTIFGTISFHHRKVADFYPSIGELNVLYPSLTLANNSNQMVPLRMRFCSSRVLGREEICLAGLTP